MRFLLSPILARGSGTGHLKRCLTLLRQLGKSSSLLIGSQHDESLLDGFKPVRTTHVSALKRSDWDFLVLDRKETGLDELRELWNFGSIIGLDEGGPARDYIPYTIDTLHNLKNDANISSIHFLDLPKRRKPDIAQAFRKILITFGGEDPSSLTRAVLECLSRTNLPEKSEITIVQGPAFTVAVEIPRNQKRRIRLDARRIRIKILKNLSNLKEILPDYDLVITSFGMTCFESLAAGVPVILFNPTRYHRKLSLKMRLPEIGIKRPAAAKLMHLLENRDIFTESLDRIRKELDEKGKSLGSHLMTLSPGISAACPVCGTDLNPVIARFRYKSYFKCSRCKIVYMIDFAGQSRNYEQSYFEEEYRRQYGRTYLEDFEAIQSISGQRLEIIAAITGKMDKKRLLDVGCAFGPFLKSCLEVGIQPFGLDPSEIAIDYVRNTLGIPCARAKFEDYASDSFDIITMWYVIEHFRQVGRILLKVNNFLPVGGIFAFSTPNMNGVSGRNPGHYLQHSPEDHYTIWTPAVARRILPRFGFKIKHIRITGHHPERFFRSKIHIRSSILMNLLHVGSLLCGLGDTFEVYAVKEAEI